MSDCNHDCSSCGVENCSSREIQKLTPHPLSNIKKIYAIISGKGGVGKSLVTSLIASEVNKRGFNVAIMDDDVTGPSIPQAFGLKDKLANTDDAGIYPVLSKKGVKIMSANLLLEDKETPIVWRGPMIASFVQQLFTDVIYGDVDYMFIDMPPGTGDVTLTAFQSIPLDGIIIVTSPQDLVSLIVKKAINMAKMMNIPILGMVENMSYVECPDCHRKIEIYGKSRLDDLSKSTGIEILGRLPIKEGVSTLVDSGNVECVELNEIYGAVEKIKGLGI